MTGQTVFEERAAHERGFAAIFADRVLPAIHARRGEQRAARASALRSALVSAGIGAGLGLVAWLLLPGAAGWITGLILATIGGFVALAFLASTARAFDTDTRTELGPVLARFMGIETYIAEPARGWIAISAFRDAHLVGRHTSETLTDGLEGTWRHVRFRLAEATLRRSKSGETGSETVFSGLLMSVETPRPMPFVVFLSEVGGVLGGLRRRFLLPDSLQPLEFPDPEVEATFEAYAEDHDAAWQALSPRFGRTLLAIARAHGGGGRVRAAFSGKRFLLALPRHEPFFPLAAFNRTDAQVAEACRQTLDDLRLPREVIDLLIDGPA